MPKGYLIAHIRVSDAEGFEAFKRMSGEAIAAHGGRVLIRNPEPDQLEGAAQGMVVVVEFDSLAAARTFYESDAYTEARRVREAASETDLVLVEGV